MNTYFIADTHFGHKNIIDLCNRPFTGINDMDETLIKRWNRTVSKNDIVYHLGDFCLGNIDKIKEYRSRLQGRIFLVTGNHDNRSYNSYKEIFDKIYDKPIIINDYFILSHVPLFVNNNMPYVNIFGHVHNNPMYKDYTQNSFCVSVERIEYKPISFKEILAKLKTIE